MLPCLHWDVEGIPVSFRPLGRNNTTLVPQNTLILPVTIQCSVSGGTGTSVSTEYGNIPVCGFKLIGPDLQYALKAAQRQPTGGLDPLALNGYLNCI